MNFSKAWTVRHQLWKNLQFAELKAVNITLCSRLSELSVFLFKACPSCQRSTRTCCLKLLLEVAMAGLFTQCFQFVSMLWRPAKSSELANAERHAALIQ